jgi:mannitol operon repressor
MSDLPRPTRPNPLDQPHLTRFKALLAEMNKESPRGMVLISTALLDEHLAECIKARIVDSRDVDKLTDGFNAPFGTFSARIAGAYALGILSEDEFHDLEIIRKIRNDFAHQISIGFDNQSVGARCSNFKLSAKDYGQVVVDPESQFSSTAIALIMRLTNRAEYVSQKRLIPEEWPY